MKAKQDSKSLKLVLHDPIFLATCLAMMLPDKLQVDIAACNMPSLKLISQFLGELATIAQNMLVLHSAICFVTCLATIEKEIHCKLQRSCYTLQCGAAACNDFKQSMQTLQSVEQSSLYFVQSLQAQKVARQVAKRACYTLDRVTLTVELGCTFFNDCRDLLKPL